MIVETLVNWYMHKMICTDEAGKGRNAKKGHSVLHVDADVLKYKTNDDEQEFHIGVEAPVAITTKLSHIRMSINDGPIFQDALNNTKCSIGFIIGLVVIFL